jgi:lipopolysaccharide export system permease protein
MNILYKYIIYSLIKWFIVVEIFILAFYVFVSIVTHTKYIEKYSATLSEIVIYDLLKIPYAFYQTIPVAISCSSVIVMIVMLKHNEIVICLTSGLKSLKLVFPFLIVSSILCIYMIISGDYINTKIEYVRNSYKKKVIENNNNYVVNRLSDLWLKEDNNTFIYIEMVDPILKTMTNLRLYQINTDFKLVKVNKIGKAQYIDGEWKYEEIKNYKIDKNCTYTFGGINIKDATLNNIIKISLNTPKSLSIQDLIMMINFYNNKGLDTKIYKFVLYKKFSYPLSAIALVLLMVPLCIKLSRHSAYVFIASKVLIFAFFYWIMQSIFETLGRNEYISPFYASFIPVFMCFAIAVYIIINREYYNKD